MSLSDMLPSGHPTPTDDDGGSLDLDYDGLVQQAVEQRRCHRRIPEHLVLFSKAAVGWEDHRALLVTGVDQLEKQFGAAGCHREVGDLVGAQEDIPVEAPEPFRKPSVTLGAHQHVDHLGPTGTVVPLPARTAFAPKAVARWLLPVPCGTSRRRPCRTALSATYHNRALW